MVVGDFLRYGRVMLALVPLTLNLALVAPAGAQTHDFPAVGLQGQAVTADYQISRGSLPDYYFADDGVRVRGAGAAGGGNGGRGGLFISVSLVPIVGGKVASPLTSSFAQATFTPSAEEGGTWQVQANGHRLLVTKPSPRYDGFADATTGAGKPARRASGTFELGAARCAGPTCNGGNGGLVSPRPLKVHVRIPIGSSSRGRLLERLKADPGSVALVTSFGDGSVVTNATSPINKPDARCRGKVGRGVRGGSCLLAGVGATKILPFVVPSGRIAPATRIGATDATVNATFSDPATLGTSSPGSGCGSLRTEDSNAQFIVSGFVNFVPVVGPGLSVATNTFGTTAGAQGNKAGDACVTSQFDLMNGQLSDQEGQIQLLQGEWTSQQNQIYAAIAAGANQVRKLDLTNYDDAVAGMVATPQGTVGIVTNAMIKLGFWKQTLEGIAPVAGATIAGSSSGTPFSDVQQAANSQAPAFESQLDDLAGSNMNYSTCTDPGCPGYVVLDPSSALLQLWVAEAQQMEEDAQQNVNDQTNVVTLFDQYNNAIVNQYQTSLGAIQQAFTLEAMVNQLNYDHATSSCTWGQASVCGMISSFGGVPGTSYQYCGSLSAGSSCPTTTLAEQTQAYNTAQKALALVYAWRVQALLDAALGFIFTDAPIGAQSYPDTAIAKTVDSESLLSVVNYAGLLGSLLPSLAGVQGTPLGNLPDAVSSGSTWEADGALYQFSGLNNINGCANAILDANDAPGAATQLPPTNPCPPPIFQTSANGPVNQGVYSGGQLQPYTSQSGTLALSGVLQLNLRLCNPTNPQLTWYSPPASNSGNDAGLVLGQWYLDCGNWAQIGQPGWTCFSGGGCPAAWGNPSSTWTWVESQYFGDSSSYPEVVSHNMTLQDGNSNNNVWAYFGSDDHGGNGSPWGTQVYFVNPSMKPTSTSVGSYSTSSSSLGDITSYGTDFVMEFPVPAKNKTTAQGVIAIPGLNQSNSSGLGFSVPVAFNLQYLSKKASIFGWQPEQNTTIADSGFTCNGWTCTVADGSQWVFANTFQTYNQETGHRMPIEMMPAS